MRTAFCCCLWISLTVLLCLVAPGLYVIAWIGTEKHVLCFHQSFIRCTRSTSPIFIFAAKLDVAPR